MKNDIKKLAEENASLKMKVLSLTQDNASMTESKGSPSPSPPDLEVIERDPTEDARILAIIKEVDDKNTKKKSKTKKKRAGVKAGGKTLKKTKKCFHGLPVLPFVCSSVRPFACPPPGHHATAEQTKKRRRK